MSSLRKDFLWGGAVAAHQLEGGWNKDGKGVSVADVMTVGANGVPREITNGVLQGKNYPNHEGIDFYVYMYSYVRRKSTSRRVTLCVHSIP